MREYGNSVLSQEELKDYVSAYEWLDGSSPEFKSRCHQGENCGTQCWEVFSGFSRFPSFIPPIHSTFQSHSSCHFIFSFIHFMSSLSSAHSPTFPSLHLRHNSVSSPSVALTMSQLILQPFRCFTYVTVHSPTLLPLLLRHRLFT